MHAKLIQSKFEKNRNRLDEFYVKDFCVLRYKELSFFIKIILTMSHGQTAVGGGFNTSLFNINNSTLKTNISPESVIAKRLMNDHLLKSNCPLDGTHLVAVRGLIY